MKKYLLSLVLALGMGAVVNAQDKAGQSEDEAAIRANAKAYVDAYNARQAAKVAALWSPEAVYSSRTSGQQLVGRKAIEEDLADLFEQQKEAKLEADVESIQFLSPNVAVEHGTARVIAKGSEPTEAQYTAVHVKRDGAWLLDRVTEDEVVVPPSHYEQLKELEWMIGDWVDQDEVYTIETQCQWARNQNFITRSFTASVADHIDMAGMQIIGWDPAAKQFRSWVFDSDGGFAEGTWKKKGNRWFIQQKGVLPDGRSSSSTNIIGYIDNDSFTWQSIDQVVGGELLPDIDEVKVVRQASP